MDNDNWLKAEVVTCPGCGTGLFAVLHSPFCDDYRLYCDRCPKAIEISFYDPVCCAVVDRLPTNRTREQIIATIEPLLLPCQCGGRFRGDAPRHCFECGIIVPAAARKDLSPLADCDTDSSRDPTPREQAAFDRFESEFVGRTNLWAANHDD